MHRPVSSRALLSSFALAAAVCTAQADEASIASGQSADGKTRADILSLKRTDGDTVTLRFAIVNDGNKTQSVTLDLVRLVDLVGRMSYSPGLTNGTCSADPGSRKTCWAVFAAPGPNTKSVSVKFYDDFDLISAPISN